MVVVLAVIGIMAVLGVYALRQNDEAEKLNKAYLELRSNLRAAQNRAQSGVQDSGSTIISVTQIATLSGLSSYTIGGRLFQLPTGIIIYVRDDSPTPLTPTSGYSFALYFHNALKTSFSTLCNGFICQTQPPNTYLSFTPSLSANNPLQIELHSNNLNISKFIKIYYNDKYIYKIE